MAKTIVTAHCSVPKHFIKEEPDDQGWLWLIHTFGNADCKASVEVLPDDQEQRETKVSWLQDIF